MTPQYTDNDPQNDWWQIAVIIMFALMCLGMCTSCRTKYIPYDVYHTEYVTRRDTTLRHDSIYLHDSVMVSRVGDTIQILKFRTALSYRDRYLTRHDTVIIRDTLPAQSVQAAHAALAQSAHDTDVGSKTVPWYTRLARWLTLILILAAMCVLAVCSAMMKKWHDGQ
jgi:hypothetical protein